MGILALSGSPSFVAVMQFADLRQRHDGSNFRRLNRSWLRCVRPQRKMGSRSVIVIEIRMERSS